MFADDMEILTISGWKRFKNLGETALVAAPTHEKGPYKFEKVAVKKESFSGSLHVVENDRLAVRVTPGSRFWHALGRSEKYDVRKVEDLPAEGRFWDLGGHYVVDVKGKMASDAKFAGFWLGDGFKTSKNRIGVGLKKDRKKKYLHRCLKDMGADYKTGPHTNRPGYEDFNIKLGGSVKECLEKYIQSIDSGFDEKCINPDFFPNAKSEEIRGLFNGLLNSDGHIKKDRPQIQFASESERLHYDWQLLSAMLGRDSHYTTHGLSLSYDPDGRTALSTSSEDFKKSAYEGDVYSVKTSTGFVFVRGANDQFAVLAVGQ